jgi:hypothetical protein
MNLGNDVIFEQPNNCLISLHSTFFFATQRLFIQPIETLARVRVPNKSLAKEQRVVYRIVVDPRQPRRSFRV